jgi:hypothetical protein
MRIRIIVLVAAVLLFGAIVMVPRIIEASKSSAVAAANSVVPVQDVNRTLRRASRSATTRRSLYAK